MARKKRRPARFDAGAAVRANARQRVGQPKPARVLPDAQRPGDRGAKHKKTLARLLAEREG